MATLIDGKSLSAVVMARASSLVKDLKAKTGMTPGLATILVGNNPASEIYVRNKIKATEKCGMRSFHRHFDANVSTEELIQHISALSGDNNVHGILVQLPLPKHLNQDQIFNTISSQKDVDGFHPYNVGLLVKGTANLRPCTPLGVMALLSHYKIVLSGKNALVIGRSDLVGKPMALMLLKENATVTIAHSQTQGLSRLVGEADIIIAASGKPEIIRGEWIKNGAVVIDVGMNRLADGTLCGDVEFAVARLRASFITPVPGGVGPMTIAMLMQNTVEAAKQCLH